MPWWSRFGGIREHVAQFCLEKGTPKVHRIASAFDGGVVANTLSVGAQAQGAVANALFALTGKRPRTLPLSTTKWA